MFVKSGGRINQWVDRIPDWLGAWNGMAFGISPDGGEGKTTITSHLFLLAKYMAVPSKTFICPSDANTVAFDLTPFRNSLPTFFTLRDIWDFGPWRDANDNPSRHCSYAYHAPFGTHVLTTSSHPGMALIADRNPWMNTARANHPDLGWDQFMPASSGGFTALRPGNSDIHQGDGQNVLYLDGHANFEISSTCGVDRDNIYTPASDDTEVGRQKGHRPFVYQYQDTVLLSPRDSFLVQEYGNKDTGQ